ncbi:unnamed protein product [Lymnaea stagnalis]|uniref:VWFD domain-containing protein n=1 Tax=Lymnaea stagnalis TaxID=6523 RepID=A0AAV2IBS4_LYMST
MSRAVFIQVVTCVIFACLQFQVSEASDVVSPCTECVANTNCVNEGCVCQGNYTGNPYFHCHLVSNLFCSLTNDPILTTFSQAQLPVYVLGATKFVQVTTTPSDTGQFCDFALFALMERLGEQLYVQSFEFNMKVPNIMFPSFNVTFMLRLESSREQNGSITWRYFTVDQGTTTLVDGVTLLFGSCSIQLQPQASLFVFVDIGCCGITVGLRPYTGRNSSYTPGLFVEINSTNQPTFGSWQASLEPLCLDQGTFTIADVQNATGLSDPIKAMTYLAQTNMIDWSYLSVLYDEKDFTESLRDCPGSRRGRLLDEAWFAFTSAPFRHCISDVETDMANVFTFITLEVHYVCNDLVQACFVAKQDIESHCNLTMFQFLQDFVDQPCDVWTEITTPLSVS